MGNVGVFGTGGLLLWLMHTARQFCTKGAMLIGLCPHKLHVSIART